MSQIYRFFRKIFILEMEVKSLFPNFSGKNFCHGIVPPPQTTKNPLYKGGYRQGGRGLGYYTPTGFNIFDLRHSKYKGVV
jgi:hypothetical protein